MCASMEGRDEVVELLLNKKANPKLKDNTKRKKEKIRQH